MKKTTSFSWILTTCAAVFVIVAHSGYRTASAAITGKISGIVKSEATQTPLGMPRLPLLGQVTPQRPTRADIM